MLNEKYLLIDEAATYLRLPKESLYKYVQRGLIPAAKIGRHWRFDRDAIDAWIAEQSRGRMMPAPEPQEPAPISDPTGRSLKVLVVDDDLSIRLILEKWITEERHSVELAADGMEAMIRLNGGAYDLIFLDLQLPRLNGGQILSRLRECDIHPPVVLITGHSDSPQMALALNYDVLYVLSKPFVRKQVQQVLLAVQTAGPDPSFKATPALGVEKLPAVG